MKTRKPEALTINVHEAARIAGWSEGAMRRAIAEGTVGALKVGRLLKVPRLPLLRLLGVDGPPPHMVGPKRDIANATLGPHDLKVENVQQSDTLEGGRS